ncbi:MAG: rhodanese-like domain-containing protein [Gammaproteobacteria bacterium]|nr:rhodanese-like domain-containing protein [Gammaproteobacteria bacterium]
MNASKLRMTYLISILLLISSSIFAKDNEFPGREKYPSIPFITIADLHKIKDNVIIVDVRSAYEHQTLRIKSALNIPVSSQKFTDNMEKLRADNKDKKIIVYCNGKTCMKSYKAALKCKKAGIKDVISYDAGIMDWANTYPNDSVLLGVSPVDRNKIISKQLFKTYLINPGHFENKIGTGNVIVLDVRDPFQRDSTALFHGKEHRVFINDATGLDKYIAKANNENKTLLIYDEVGKQVRWLQYYLEGKGAKSYSFMKGGVKNYYKYLDEKYKF